MKTDLPLTGLIETLELLITQAAAYERALPPDNYPARAAVANLGELARQALNEAQELAHIRAHPSIGPMALSPRELQVLQLAGLGLTNKEIGHRLGISERTVQFHMNSIFNKTATNSRTEAVARGISHGWIDPIP